MEQVFWVVVLAGATAGIILFCWNLFRRWKRWRDAHTHTRFQDALKHLLAISQRGQPGTSESLAGALGLSHRSMIDLVARMEAQGVVQSSHGAIELTPEGRGQAVQVVRAHRLLERYLADEAGVPLSKIHGVAERAEHALTTENMDELEAHLGHPLRDPHGDPIPTADGTVTPLGAVPLTDWPANSQAHIVHVEDEPETVFRQILERGLEPGAAIRVLESAPESLLVTDGKREHRLPPVIAANIHVRAAPVEPRQPEGTVPLTDLPGGTVAEVVALDPHFRGFARRRLLDLGLTPGARVSAELTNAFGDPRAYRVRGTVVALRKDQAKYVWVRSQSLAKGGTAS